jgi:hypothetical protein
MAPKRVASERLKPRVIYAINVIITQVTQIPIVIKLRTTFPTSYSSESFKLNPPSKSIIATETDTTGSNRSPKRASGFRNPVTGPATKPKTRRNKIGGTRRR